MQTITDLMTLQYALRLAEAGSFRGAAEECHVTQPTISVQIRRLEESLGYELFERTPRGVHATPRGELFLARAREVVQAWERLFSSGEDAASGTLSGPLSLGVIPTLGPYLLPPLHALLRREAPDLRLSFLEEQTSLLLHRLLRGQLDCAVVALPLEEESLSVWELAEDPFLVVTRKRRGGRRSLRDRLAPGDLPPEGLLLLADGHCFRGQALEVCATRPNARVRVEGSSFATLLNLVELDSEESYTLLPETARAELATRPGLQALRFAAPVPSRRLGLVMRKSSPWLASAPLLAGHLQSVLAGLLGGR